MYKVISGLCARRGFALMIVLLVSACDRNSSELSPVLKGAARVSGYLSSHPDFYKDRTWQLAEYECNQPWAEKYGNPHVAPSCWWNSTLRFTTSVVSRPGTAPDPTLNVTNICGRSDESHLVNGYTNNDLRFLSEQDNGANYSVWSDIGGGLVAIRRTVGSIVHNRSYIVEVWDGGHLFLIRTDSHNGQFAYEKYHYVQQ